MRIVVATGTGMRELSASWNSFPEPTANKRVRLILPSSCEILSREQLVTLRGLINAALDLLDLSDALAKELAK